MQLSTTKYQSRVLMSWLGGRPGASERAGVNAMLPENGTVSSLNVDELARALGAATLTAAGVPVTPEIALRVSTVYGCTALISGAIATLPFPVYQRADDGSRSQARHDYFWMLNEQANPECTSSVALEYLISSRLFYGDGFAVLERPNNFTNTVTGWRPLHPSRVEPFYESQADALRYRVTNRGGKQRVYDPADIIHVPSMGFDGLRSPSPITYAARESIGVSLAAQEYTARFFSQGSTHDIALRAPRKLTDDQLEALRKSYAARYTGGRNARVPLILSGGMEVEKLSITPQDAQLILLEQFTVEEICRVLGVPPFMVGAMDKTTSWGSGVESMGINFVKYTLRRHLTPIEQEFNRKLWPNREKYFVEFNVASLERGDSKTRNEAYRAALGGAGMPGFMTPDEVRHLENLPPIEGGDKLFDGGGQAAADAAKSAAKAVASKVRTEISALTEEVKALRDRPLQNVTNVDARTTTTIAEGAVQTHAGDTVVDARTSIEPGAVQLDAPVTVHSEVQPAAPSIHTYPLETEETITRDDKGEIKSIVRRAKE